MARQRRGERVAHDLVTALPDHHRRSISAGFGQGSPRTQACGSSTMRRRSGPIGLSPSTWAASRLARVAQRCLGLAPARARITGIDDRHLPLVQSVHPEMLCNEMDRCPGQGPGTTNPPLSIIVECIDAINHVPSQSCHCAKAGSFTEARAMGKAWVTQSDISESWAKLIQPLSKNSVTTPKPSQHVECNQGQEDGKDTAQRFWVHGVGQFHAPRCGDQRHADDDHRKSHQVHGANGQAAGATSADRPGHKDRNPINRRHGDDHAKARRRRHSAVNRPCCKALISGTPKLPPPIPISTDRNPTSGGQDPAPRAALASPRPDRHSDFPRSKVGNPITTRQHPEYTACRVNGP